MYKRASGASELRKISTFSHSKTAISFNILLVLQIVCLRNIYFQVSNNICIHIQSMQFLYLWHGAIVIDNIIYRQNTNIEKMYVYASEL